MCCGNTGEKRKREMETHGFYTPIYDGNSCHVYYHRESFGLRKSGKCSCPRTFELGLE